MTTNMIIRCNSCHKIVERDNEKTLHKYYIDDEGNVICKECDNKNKVKG